MKQMDGISRYLLDSSSSPFSVGTLVRIMRIEAGSTNERE